MFTHVGLRAALRRPARHHEIRDDDLNGLVVLVAAGGFEVALDQEPHGDRGRVPTTGGQSSEDRVARGFFVEMERLRIELGAECLDSLRVNPHPTGAKGLPDGKVFEESPNHVY